MTTGQPVFDELPEDAMIRLNQACNRFEQLWLAGDCPPIESMLADWDIDSVNALVRNYCRSRLSTLAARAAMSQFKRTNCDSQKWIRLGWLPLSAMTQTPSEPSQATPATFVTIMSVCTKRTSQSIPTFHSIRLGDLPRKRSSLIVIEWLLCWDAAAWGRCIAQRDLPVGSIGGIEVSPQAFRRGSSSPSSVD